MSEYSKYVQNEHDEPKSYNKGYVRGLVLNAAMGSFFFGYLMSDFNPVKDFVQSYAFSTPVSEISLTFMTGFVPLGAAVGALTAGKFAASVGRRKAMFIVDIIAIIGTILTLLPFQASLLTGRLIQGYCVGANSSLVPLVINEVAPAEVIGAMGTLNPLLLSIGVLTAPLVGLAMPDNGATDPNSQVWRLVLAIAGLPAIIRLFMSMTVFRFDTPKYLISTGDEKGTKTVLIKIYGEKRAAVELERLRNQNELEQQTGKPTLSEMFTPKYSKRLMIGVVVAILQQTSGINAIVFFSNDIFGIGLPVGTNKPMIYTVIMDICQIVSNVIAGLFIEKLGRRLLFLGGITYTTIVLGAFSLVSLMSPTSPFLKFLIWGFMFGFGISMGPMPWIYTADILPDVGIGLAVLANWVSAFFIGIGFPTIANNPHLGMPFGFAVFAACTAAGSIFVAIFIKETKGKTKGEINEMFISKSDDVTGSFSTNIINSN